MESAAPTFMRTFGFHPLVAFVDHGSDGAGGEVLAGSLRLGNANATPPQAGGTPGATDHISVLDMALAQLPGAVRSRVVVRADSGGGTKAFLTRITNLGSGYSIVIGTAVGVGQHLLGRLPQRRGPRPTTPTGSPRDGAQVTELTGMLPWLTGHGWRQSRRERPNRQCTHRHGRFTIECAASLDLSSGWFGR